MTVQERNVQTGCTWLTCSSNTKKIKIPKHRKWCVQMCQYEVENNECEYLTDCEWLISEVMMMLRGWVWVQESDGLGEEAPPNCAFTPQAARASKWPEVIHFQCEPAASSGESGAASFGRWERRGELKSSQLYGNELWRGSAATNQNVEVLRLRGFQRTQSCKLWFRPH